MHNHLTHRLPNMHDTLIDAATCEEKLLSVLFGVIKYLLHDEPV